MIKKNERSVTIPLSEYESLKWAYDKYRVGLDEIETPNTKTLTDLIED